MRVPFLLAVALLVMAMAACTSASPAPAQPTPTPTAPAATATPGPEPEPGDLFLNVSEPQDESVVTTADVTVRGSTLTDAVVTVNGEPVEVESDGSFEAMVTLEDGPNVIEVLASDFDGNEEAVVLVVIYAPES